MCFRYPLIWSQEMTVTEAICKYFPRNLLIYFPVYSLKLKATNLVTSTRLSLIFQLMSIHWVWDCTKINNLDTLLTKCLLLNHEWVFSARSWDLSPELRAIIHIAKHFLFWQRIKQFKQDKPQKSMANLRSGKPQQLLLIGCFCLRKFSSNLENSFFLKKCFSLTDDSNFKNKFSAI